MVDIGGIYFQTLLVPLVYMIYLLCGDLIFLYTIYAITASSVTSLNPLLRFDGYWLASDLAGVPNLRKRSASVLRYLLQRLIKGERAAMPLFLQVTTKTKYFLYAYTVFCNLFFALFIYQIVLYLPELIRTYPSLLSSCLMKVVNDINIWSLNVVLYHLSPLVFPTIILFMVIIMIYRRFLHMIKWIVQRLTKTTTSVIASKE